MHRFTVSMPSRAMILRLARNSNLTSLPTQLSANPSSRVFSSIQVLISRALTSRALTLPFCISALVSPLVGCQTTDSTNTDTATKPPITINTAEVYTHTPVLTIVAPESSQRDDSAFVQVTENNLNVTQVVAKDNPGSTLIYRLQDGEDKDHFVLNENTGTLQFKEIPDWEQPKDADADNNYTVLWQVVSSSGDARSQFLVVQVTDLPE